jgi:2-amino-4-hydroxy-6-hydroxymethyldihydropteridine diphosphokinase
MFVSMEMSEKSNVFLLLGTNLGDRLENLTRARAAIAKRIGKITRSSSIYQTAPWGAANQPDFFNQVVVAETEIGARDVLHRILDIENELGRIREKKWGSRLIDIDILFYDQQIIQSENLTIPHPGIPSRRFTLIPLVEIDEQFIHPALRKDMRTLLRECADNLSVVKI